MGYTIDGIRVKQDENMIIDYAYDSQSNANYFNIRIFKKKIDGSYQYPFVYAPDGIGGATKSALELGENKNFDIIINAGLFSGTNQQIGLLIQNGVMLQQSENNGYPLTIDSNGDLGFCQPGTDGNILVQQGIVSALYAWGPWVVDYEEVTYDTGTINENAQRQIIGQYGNGDYAILTCDGRSFNHSDGWTKTEAVSICKKHGLKFAYNLDGGGSTETVIGKKQLNMIYEGAKGRKVPTFIVFNGTNHFVS